MGLPCCGRGWVDDNVEGSSSGDPVRDTLARSSRGLGRPLCSDARNKLSTGGFASVPDLNLRQMLRIRSYNAIEAMDFEPRDSANRCTERPYRFLCNFGAGQGWLGTRKRNWSNDLD